MLYIRIRFFFDLVFFCGGALILYYIVKNFGGMKW